MNCGRNKKMVAIFFFETIDSSANFSTIELYALRRISQQSFVSEHIFGSLFVLTQNVSFFATLKYRKIIFDSSLSFHNVPNDCLKHSYIFDRRDAFVFYIRGEAAKSCYFFFIVHTQKQQHNGILFYLYFFFHNISKKKKFRVICVDVDAEV